MSIYSKVESGTSFARSRFTKSISYGVQYDAQFGALVTVFRKFCLPGDVWRIGGQVLVRLQPMLSPPMNRMQFKVRYFFVPLRLIEPDAELVITGSKDGHLYSGTLPVLDNVFTKADTSVDPDALKITQHSLLDYMGCQVGDYSSFATDECLPAAYWTKSYHRIYWDYYDDENIGYFHQSFTDYQAFENYIVKLGGNVGLQYAPLPKDYFTSTLPWQIKGVAPTITLGVGSIDFSNCFVPQNFTANHNGVYAENNWAIGAVSQGLGGITGDNSSQMLVSSSNLENALSRAQVSLSGSLDADDIRTMFAQTRIFERLARTGSRYTEYLRANFGTAPADDTLQRAQYLGGWKIPIVTTEVLQTAADGSSPVGTMRGHGITNGGNRINTFHCREFGVIIGIAHVMPEIKYTTGCPREMSYKRRFDFFNPSFQHLSEQEVRNGELWIGSDNKNDDTFGFQAYANELRTSQSIVVGAMRANPGLGYWNQAIEYSARPNLNDAFINSFSYRANFNKPFAVSGANAYPLVIDFYNDLDVYRPMVRYATPGLVDHL